MKYIATLIVLLLGLAAPSAATAAMTGDWQTYPSFHTAPLRTVETPGRVYFAGYPSDCGGASSSVPDMYMALHCYDKESGEFVPLSRRNRLSEEYILDFAYNDEKKYLLVVYDNFNIDLLYEDGTVRNISTLMTANIPGKKAVNLITFYPKANQAFIATHFGYVCIDDSDYEISESRIFNQDLKAACRIGDRMLLSDGANVYLADYKSPRMSLSDYKIEPQLNGTNIIYNLDDNLGVGISGGRGVESIVNWIAFKPGTFEIENHQQIDKETLTDIQPGVGGLYATYYATAIKYCPGRLRYMRYIDEHYWGAPLATADFTTGYSFKERLGMRSFDITNPVWTAKTDFMRPNVPAANYSFNIKYSPKYGLLVGSHGAEGMFAHDFGLPGTGQISGLKDGRWKEYSHRYTYPERGRIDDSALGMALDPDDSKYVWRGSTFHGIVRYNLEDPEDILHLGNNADWDNGKPGFIKITEAQPSWKILCRMSYPQFDAKGDMYFTQTVYDYSDPNATGEPLNTVIWRWSAENRRATTDADHFRPLEHITLPYKDGSNAEIHLVLTNRANANTILIYTNLGYENRQLIILDHNGTFDNQADDKLISIRSGYDQDGGSIDLFGINWMTEDPETGLVWFATDSGVYTMNVNRQNSSTGTFNRVKVARNDGTSLADYLLNEVKVNHILDDGQGRKWFSTLGGLVCTSSDGRRILGEFTRENSYIPSDNVFSTGYDPSTGSLMISTDRGLSLFTPSGTSSVGGAESGVRAYPNPVEPDYYGFVTIDGIPDNSLVKIADAGGGLVRELGRAESGSIQWDLTNHEHKRVSTGVYYILASPGDNSSDGKSSVGKILILN